MTSGPDRPRRADAQRSRAAILDATLRLLSTRPDAGLEAIAAAAGVSRQTVYAHFPSRRHLIRAALDRVTAAAVEAMDAARPDAGPAAEALLRVVEASARVALPHRVLLEQARALPADPRADRELHAPVAERLQRIIRRGQGEGELDARLPPAWLATAVISLAHAAGDEADAGRMSADEATDALHTSVLRLLGVGRGP